MKTYTHTNGVFPQVPKDTPIRLDLGNGTGLTVMVTSSGYIGVETCGRMGGFYRINTVASGGYIMEKFRMLDGDGNHFADFINDQNMNPGTQNRQGDYSLSDAFKPLPRPGETQEECDARHERMRKLAETAD